MHFSMAVFLMLTPPFAVRDQIFSEENGINGSNNIARLDTVFTATNKVVEISFSLLLELSTYALLLLMYDPRLFHGCFFENTD